MTRVFVSQHDANSSNPGVKLTTLLLADLRAAGADVVTASDTLSEAEFVLFMDRELPTCQWLLVVQTPEAFHSLRIQATVSTAVNLVKQGAMKGVLRIVDSSSDGGEELPLWSEIPAIAFSGDYPRLRDKILLELGLLRVDDGTSQNIPVLPLPSGADLHPGSFNSTASTSPNVRVTRGDRPLQGIKDRPLQESMLQLNADLAGTRFGRKDTPASTPGNLVDHPVSPSRTTRRFGRLWFGLLALLVVLAGIATGVVISVRHSGSSQLGGSGSSQLGGHTTVASAPPSIATFTPASTLIPTPTLIPTSTLTTAQGIYTWATSRVPAFNDAMNVQDGNQWSENGRACTFTGGAYQVSQLPGGGYAHCMALAPQYSQLQNFAFQVQIEVAAGDAGGLLFHSNSSETTFYGFTYCVNQSCHKGAYGLHLRQPTASRLAFNFPSALKAELTAINTLTVVVLGAEIYLYINQQYVGHVHDNTLNAGQIGITAYSGQDATQVICHNAVLWLLPTG